MGESQQQGDPVLAGIARSGPYSNRTEWVTPLLYVETHPKLAHQARRRALGLLPIAAACPGCWGWCGLAADRLTGWV